MKNFVIGLSIITFTCLAGIPLTEAATSTWDITYDHLPKDSQLYPRDQVSNTATVMITGTVHSEGFDSIQITTYRNGTEVSIENQSLVYDADTNAVFALTSTITAELANYDFDVQLMQGIVTCLVNSVTNVVAGDVVLINGQSNAVAGNFGQSSNGNISPFLRSFGIRNADSGTVSANVTWNVAVGDGGTVGHVGQWGIRMGRLLVDTFSIPIAIINHANGGKPISFFQRNDGNHEDLNNNYGRMLFRAREAGVTNHVRSILWYQGESDGGNATVHEDGFIELYNDWKENFPAIERVYVHQLRVGCGVTKNDVDLRDRQRRLADKFSDISAMSTTGADGHDGCHYAFTNGYEKIGEHIFELVGRDLYGAPDLPNIEAPNVVDKAFFEDGAMTSLIVRTRNATDTLVFDAGAEADFLLSGAAVTVTGGSASGNELTLGLSGSGAGATGISYTGHSGAGAWVTNSEGVGLLTFSISVSPFLGFPDTPTNLQGNATPLLEVELSWDSVSNAASYIVRRDGTNVGVSVGPAYTDNGLAPLTSYDYDVAAVNAQGTSAFSTVVMVTTPAPPPPPDTPTGLVATAQSAISIGLDWPFDTNAVSYLVQRDSVVIAGSFTNTYTDGGLTATTTYDYAIAAVNPGGTSAFSSVVSATTLAVNVFAFVPEATNLQVVYRMEIPDAGNFRDATPVPYIEDNTASISGCIERIAYYLELDSGSGLEWVYVSMDPFTLDATQVGLPHNVDNPVKFQQIVSNMNVFASAGAGVVTGTVISTGNIEMWPSNYGADNDAGIPGADSNTWDFGDGSSGTGAGYGSFQVHNHGALETIFAYNAWGNSNNDEVGIGNRPTGDPDWTFSGNAASYIIKNLIVLVQELETPPLTVPTNFVASGVSPLEATLSWDAVPGAQFYDVRLDGGSPVTTINTFETFVGLEPDTEYDVDVSAGNCMEQTLFSPSVTFTSQVVSVFTNVAEASGYELLYMLEIEDNGNYRDATPVPYALDYTAAFTSCIDRVAYYLELDSEWVYVSMDPFTFDVNQVGLPHNVDNPVLFQQVVSNMNVFSSAGAGVATGTSFSTGNVEMWPGCYTDANGLGLPGADNGLYDWDDSGGTVGACYGSFQVHNHGTPEVIFGYNRWSNTGTDDLGIGSQPSNEPDWTFAGNAPSYTTKRLAVLVRPLTPPALTVPTNLVASGVSDVQVTLSWDPVPGAEFYDVRLDGGPPVRSTDASTIFDKLLPDTTYDLDVSAGNNCSALTPYSPSITVTTLVASVFTNVAEASGFELLYTLEVEDNGNYRSATPVPYIVDNAATFTGCFDRVAYYLELDSEWVFVSMDPFTLDVGQLGLPHNVDNPVTFQQLVSNMDVFASPGAGVATGTTITTGNIEFWPNNYSDGNAISIPNASGTSLDFGDTIAAANPGYSCLQIHNHDLDGVGAGTTGETIFAYNAWGAGNADDAGIGNDPNTGRVNYQPDWTFSGSASSYATKKLAVLVRRSTPPPLTVPTNLVVSGLDALQATLSWDAVPGTQFYDIRVDGVLSATTNSTSTTFSCLEPDTAYQLDVSAGNCAEQTTFSPSITVTTLVAAVFVNVPEASSFDLVYALDIEDDGNYRNANPVPYCADRTASITGLFDRIAYYLELDSGSGLEWVYVSMDAFTNDVNKIGLPHNTNAVSFQQVVANMNVFAGGGAEAKVTTGTGMATGNIEMWPNSYTTGTGLGGIGGNAGLFDFDDTKAGANPGHSCFQVHNHGAAETVFAYNHWGAGGSDSVGIGNQPTNHPDWTLSYNAAIYTTKRLYVLTRSAGIDSDMDGILDDWELLHFGSLTNVNESSDWDMDGFLDIAEFIAGTAPTNAMSLLDISIQPAPDGNGFLIQWPSVSGRLYQVERSTNELENWTLWSTNVLPTFPENTVTNTEGSIDRATYRISVGAP